MTVTTSLIVTDEEEGKYRLTWALEDDIGGHLGDGVPSSIRSADIETAPDDEEWAHLAASAAAAVTAGCERDTLGFYWSTRKDAQKALRAAKTILKQGRQHQECNWPIWARQAKAAGWVPPKNWTP